MDFSKFAHLIKQYNYGMIGKYILVSEGSIKYKPVDLNNWFVKFELIVGRHSNLPEGEVGTCVAICIEEIPNDYYIQFLFSSNLHYREIRKYGYVTNWRTL